jgi:hypothetical protein
MKHTKQQGNATGGEMSRRIEGERDIYITRRDVVVEGSNGVGQRGVRGVRANAEKAGRGENAYTSFW